eukprot:NODE_463_length_7125_cov_0.998292.p5 type:complete len:242 gc:universal NODE_463_length_7125_cov_0.998292:4785-5510(+)
MTEGRQKWTNEEVDTLLNWLLEIQASQSKTDCSKASVIKEGSLLDTYLDENPNFRWNSEQCLNKWKAIKKLYRAQIRVDNTHTGGGERPVIFGENKIAVLISSKDPSIKPLANYDSFTNTMNMPESSITREKNMILKLVKQQPSTTEGTVMLPPPHPNALEPNENDDFNGPAKKSRKSASMMMAESMSEYVKSKTQAVEQSSLQASLQKQKLQIEAMKLVIGKTQQEIEEIKANAKLLLDD